MQQKFTGFTLLELIFTLAIMTLVLLSSRFFLPTFFNKYLIDNDTQRLFATLQFARTEAIKQNKMITVCPTQDFVHCSRHWSDGYIVFFEHHHEENLLRSEKISKLTSFQTQSLTRIQFSGDGRCLARGTILIRAPLEKHTKKIVIYDSGRIRIDG